MNTVRPQRGVSIRLFLADGTPDGLWVAEKSNWAGVALVVPRTLYSRVRSEREEMRRAGVYVLTGPSETSPDRTRVYIGEADALRTRLDYHHRGTDFWTRAVVFASKDGSLNKAHVKHIESRLITLAHEAGRCEVGNSNAPALPALSEAERADTEAFLDDMLMIYPVVGVEAFEIVPVSESEATDLRLQGLGAEGRGRETSDGFVVLAGSVARADVVPSIHAYLKDLRQSLAQTGVLNPEDRGLRFTSDYLFNSPSTAAGVLLGRSANGRIEWKDPDGRTLKEIQAAEVTQTPSLLEPL